MSLGSLDGEILPVSELRLPVTDAAVLRGDGVFDALRLYGGRPYALAEHLERMARSAATARLALDVGVLEREVRALLAASEPGDAVLRLVATRGGRRLVLIEALEEVAPSVRLATVTYAPTRILDGVKSLSYAANMLATRLAHERDADEALLCTPHGRVLEGPTSAFFAVLDGELVTPPLSDHVLDSITRRRVLEATTAREAVVAVDDLRRASGAALASSLRELQPVSRIDDLALDVGDPVIVAAATATRERIAAGLERTAP